VSIDGYWSHFESFSGHHGSFCDHHRVSDFFCGVRFFYGDRFSCSHHKPLWILLRSPQSASDFFFVVSDFVFEHESIFVVSNFLIIKMWFEKLLLRSINLMKSKQIKLNLKSRKFRPNLYGTKYKMLYFTNFIFFWFEFLKILFLKCWRSKNIYFLKIP
jgi:hypothetical protein